MYVSDSEGRIYVKARDGVLGWQFMDHSFLSGNHMIHSSRNKKERRSPCVYP